MAFPSTLVRRQQPMWRWMSATALSAALSAALTTALLAPAPATAATPAEAATTPAAPQSAMDAPLFYQVLIGELELRAGRLGAAYEVILDAARRQGDDALFERAIQIALQARAGEQALGAAEAWRQNRPNLVAPLRYQSQILVALDRGDDAAEAVEQWLKLLPETEQPALIASLPRLFQRAKGAEAMARRLEQVLQPYLDKPLTRLPSLVALAHAKLLAGQTAEALAIARAAQKEAPADPGPVLLALELMRQDVAAEELVTRYLAGDPVDPQLRMAYVRTLTQANRFPEARAQLETAVRIDPARPDPWLMLGAIQVELRESAKAEDSLRRYLALVQPAAPDAAASASSPSDAASTAEPPASAQPELREREAAARSAGINQAWLLLAQAAEQRGDLAGADALLARVDAPQRLLEVTSRRAALLARQGQVDQARQLLRSMPERTGADAHAKRMAEVQLLRELKRWDDSAAVLDEGLSQSPDDLELLYERAMVDEKQGQFDLMERRLRRVIELKPDHPHAHNALGYSLADRNIRLDEAEQLIQRALTLQPADPFITDSLGWVAFRQGRREEAIRTLNQAYDARPDPEIAAHLGEVLWADGQRDRALKIWREGLARESGNAVLRETLQRLNVQP